MRDNKNSTHLGQDAVLGKGDSIVIPADEEQDSKNPDLEILLLGGATHK
jgi:hypothetical protein